MNYRVMKIVKTFLLNDFKRVMMIKTNRDCYFIFMDDIGEYVPTYCLKRKEFMLFCEEQA